MNFESCVRMYLYIISEMWSLCSPREACLCIPRGRRCLEGEERDSCLQASSQIVFYNPKQQMRKK